MEKENKIKPLIIDGKIIPGCFVFDSVERNKEIEKEILRIIEGVKETKVFRRNNK